MKKFLVNSSIFLLILVVVLQVRPLYLLYKDRYMYTVTGSEIYHSIFKSKEKKKAKKILLGDSVGNQLFPNTAKNDTINSLACNQSIGMVGQYLLLNNYLNAGNEIDTAYLLFSPFTFQNNLDQVYTFHYFLKPFDNKEYRPLFTETVKQQIEKVPFHNLSRFPLILTSNWAPDFTPKEKHDYSFLSPISVEYLQKIKELSVKHHFKVIILPPPISKEKKDAVAKMDRSEITKNNLDAEFSNYFNSLVYLDDSIFIDGTHFKSAQLYTAYMRQNLIR